MPKQRIKPEKVSLDTLKVARDALWTTKRADFDAEMRFAKLQQGTTVAATITLLGAIYQMTRQSALTEGERWVAVVIVMAIELAGGWILIELQKHMGRTRRGFDAMDRSAYLRPFSDVVVLFLIAIIATALLVAYSIGWPTIQHLN